MDGPSHTLRVPITEAHVTGVTLDVHKGDLLAIVGPTGTGKSRLARWASRLLSLENPDERTSEG